MELKAALAALLTSSLLLSPRTVQPCSMSGYSRNKHSSPKLITLQMRKFENFHINSLINKNFLLFTKRQKAWQFLFFFIFINNLRVNFQIEKKIPATLLYYMYLLYHIIIPPYFVGESTRPLIRMVIASSENHLGTLDLVQHLGSRGNNPPLGKVSK